MTGVKLGGILIKGGLRRGIVGQHTGEIFQIFEEIWIGKVACFEIGEEDGKSDGSGSGEEIGAISRGVDKVEYGGEE